MTDREFNALRERVMLRYASKSGGFQRVCRLRRHFPMR